MISPCNQGASGISIPIAPPNCLTIYLKKDSSLPSKVSNLYGNNSLNDSKGFW